MIGLIWSILVLPHQEKRARLLCGGLLGHVVQVSTQQLGSFDIIPAVQLLVGRVSGIGGAAHGQQKDILASGFLEGQCHGNTIRSR